MLSALDAQAATHECADTVGVCNYVFSSGVKTYKATPVFDKVDQRYEWNCGFGNGQVSCPEEPATSVSPTPTPPPSSGGNTPPTTSKGNQTQAVEGTYLGEEETITKIVDRCPCPTCGDKHYDCIAGKGSTLGASAKNKKETKSQFTGPDGIRRNVTTWTWRCIDSCGNLTGECREEKQDVANPCDETACANSDDCSKCAKCSYGAIPFITTTAEGKCRWSCRYPQQTGNSYWCSATIKKKPGCGEAHGIVGKYEYHVYWTGDIVTLYGYLTTYYTKGNMLATPKLPLCQAGYYLCNAKEVPLTDPKGARATWTCCKNGATCNSNDVANCADCGGTLYQIPTISNLDFYEDDNTTGGGVIIPSNDAATAPTATVGVGVFRPSTWY